MNLLLSNDDGYQSEGIKVLAKRLSEKHNVYIIAPESNRSAVSHCISMFRGLKIIKIDEKIWACSGYPSDCVSAGIIGNLIDVKIDAVISGINHGANMGTDIIYSGTCGAARQGVLLGVPSVALSVDCINSEQLKRGDFKFEALADFAAKNLETLISLAKTDFPRIFVNVNADSLDEYKGVKFNDSLCRRHYNDSMKISKCETSDEYDSVFHCGKQVTDSSSNGDYSTVAGGYISVTRVYADPVPADVVDGVSFSL